MKAAYTEYGNWEPDFSDLPPRSRLYPLAPVKTGSAQTECLTSYLMRLAAAHCLFPGTLYRYVIQPQMRAETTDLDREPGPISLGKWCGVIRAAHCWNGTERSASGLVRTIEGLTCAQGLHLLTWLPWKAVLSHQGLLRPQRAWCPQCLSQWQSEGQTIYEPLLWTLHVVRICLVHNCALVEVCPFCRQSLYTLTANVRAGHCSKCQRWLGHTGEDQRFSAPIQESNQLQKQRWIVQSIGELIAKAPGLSNSPSSEWKTENLENLISQMVRGAGPDFAELNEGRSKMLSFWQGGRAIPRLEFILKLCYRFDFSVADFLTAMIGRQSCEDRIDVLSIRRAVIAEWDANVRRTLEAALQEEPPPTLTELAGRLGYASPSRFYAKHADLSRRITARYRRTFGRYHLIRPAPDGGPTRQLRRLLKQELSKVVPCHPGKLAVKAGYKSAYVAKRQCPELWRELLDKHIKSSQEEKRKQREHERELITAALSENPTPTVREVVRRLGHWSQQTLRSRFPEEFRAISEKRTQQKEGRLEEIKARLLEALSEEPPPSMRQIAAKVCRNRNDLYSRWGELCRAIAARHTDYVRERAMKKRLALKK